MIIEINRRQFFCFIDSCTAQTQTSMMFQTHVSIVVSLPGCYSQGFSYRHERIVKELVTVLGKGVPRLIKKTMMIVGKPQRKSLSPTFCFPQFAHELFITTHTNIRSLFYFDNKSKPLLSHGILST
jgi:hypothetical protein